MGPPPKSAVTSVLQKLAKGGEDHSTLVPVVYEELRSLARASIARLSPGQTLQATALVHEAWLRVASAGSSSWNDRRHFFRAAAMAMRHVLVDQARRKASLKHGGGRQRAEADPDAPFIAAPVDDVLAVDEALDRLRSLHPRQHEVVMLRFFGGAEEKEIASVLEISRTTVQEDWRFARAWLMRELDDSGLES